MAVTADLTIIAESVGDYFSKIMISEDFNTDGKTDLVMNSDEYGSSIGRIYIFYNDGSIPTTAVSADVKITGEVYLAISLASGDFNNDGRLDLAAGTNYSEKAHFF